MPTLPSSFRSPGRLLALLVGVSLVASTALAATTLIFELSNSTADETVYMKSFDAPTFALGDFNGDGKKEIVASNDNQWLYVLSSTSPHVYAELRSDYPSGWGARMINDPAVVDLDGDGKLDIAMVNSAGVVCNFEFNGMNGDRMHFNKNWCKRMDKYAAAGADAGAEVADVDGDGKYEIFSQTETLGLYAFNHDGTIRWSKNTYGGNAGPLVTDLENDGKKDVIFFGDGGEVKAFDASTGSSKWSFWASNYVKPASIPVSGNAADLDGDGKKEVVFFARDAHDATTFSNDHIGIFVLSSSGNLKKWWQPSWANPLSYTHPVLVDVDGDGKKDIVGFDWNTIGHKPGNWEKTGPANAFAFKWDGTQLWRTVIDDSWSNDDVLVADADGDGAQEVIAIGYGPGGDGVWLLNLRTGAKESHIPIGNDWQINRMGVVSDLDNSGDAELVLPVHRSARGGAFRFFDLNVGCNVVYGGWQNHDPCGTGPSGDGSGGTPTPPPPPPPTGDFSATFSQVSGNNWWVQVKVGANQQLAGVDARVNGGTWRPLEFKSWGSWAASFNIPSGSQVQFQARSTGGGSMLSGCYQWTAASPVACSGGSAPPPPPAGSFSATFKNVRGNEWWVETDVTANEPLAGVDARVNGGTWVPLEKKSWGSWAKSFHVSPGAKVEFRARSTGGGEVMSSPYTWPPG